MTENKLYVDRVAPSIPEWYAEFKYDPDKSFREEYMMIANNPYQNEYKFYHMRNEIMKDQQQNADTIFNQRQDQIRNQINMRLSNQWRNKVNFVL